VKPIYVYPASFCPPTFGHLHTVVKAAELFPNVTLVCSVNQTKNGAWFSPDESKTLWSTYSLPSNTNVLTFDELSHQGLEMSSFVMVRGIRDENDAEYEKKVMLFNKERFGIEKYVYLFSGEQFRHISSSKVRDAALRVDLEELSGYVSPLVVSKLLEKTLGINHLFMVVGKPGSGKSTFLKALVKKDPNNVWVNTDDFNHRLRPLLVSAFGREDLVTVALTREEELKKVIAKPWMSLLEEALKSQPKESNVFVEVPFGMQPDKTMFRFLGGKVIYVGCDDKETTSRIIARGTPQHLAFASRIPDLAETKEMAKKHHLCLFCAKTNGSLSALESRVERFNLWLNKEENTWKTFLPGSCLDI